MNKSVLALSLLTCLILSPVSKAPAAQASTNYAVKMSSFSLSSQRGKNRLLLVFTPSEQNRAYQQQIQLFSQYKQGFADRDLVLVQVLAQGNSYANGEEISSSSAAQLRHRFGVSNSDFRVVLVGKDGGTKRSDSNPVHASAIFNEIDAMPMRRQEMRQRSSS
ncbi:MAG: DUF4174 domain-containing protein [Stigonema ocellatum SAG 48.90 = DSM 106950]|nr:DUF4174 domain-containing protein [Stigonema ocellatum SAG 48.90 = DSM 106950]